MFWTRRIIIIIKVNTPPLNYILHFTIRTTQNTLPRSKNTHTHFSVFTYSGVPPLVSMVLRVVWDGGVSCVWCDGVVCRTPRECGSANDADCGNALCWFAGVYISSACRIFPCKYSFVFLLYMLEEVGRWSWSVLECLSKF